MGLAGVKYSRVWLSVLVFLFTTLEFVRTVDAAPPEEVTGLTWCPGTRDCLTWAPAPGAAQYTVYRGTLGSLPDVLVRVPDSCVHAPVTTTTTGPAVHDVPGPCGVYWYLVTAGNADGEGTAGSASSGPRLLDAYGSCELACIVDTLPCSVSVQCCSGRCVEGLCREGCCRSNGSACSAPEECCSNSCVAGNCAPASGGVLTATPSTNAASAGTAAHVSLDWTPGTGSTASAVWIYRVPSGDSFDFNAPLAANVALSALPYADSTVALDSSYDYVVRPGIANGSPGSTLSNVAAGTLTLTGAPSVTFFDTTASAGDAGFDGTCSIPSCIAIAWSQASSTTANSFNVLGSDDAISYTPIAGSPFAAASICNGGTCKVVEGSLQQAGQPALGKIRSYDVSGVNATGAGVSGTLVDTAVTPPAAPSSVAAIGGRGQIALSWSSAARQFKLRRRPAGGSYSAHFINVVRSSYTDTGAGIPDGLGPLAAGFAYEYELTAQVAADHRTVDGGAVSPVGAAVIPATPTGVSGTTPGSGSVLLTWTNSTCATNYDVLMSDSTGGPFSFISSQPGPSDPCGQPGNATVSATVGGLTDGLPYCFEVSSRNFGVSGDAATASVPSAPAACVTLEPAAPTGVAAEGDAGQVTVYVSWNASVGAASYNLYRYPTGVPESRAGIQSGLTGTSATDTDPALIAGTSYTYLVTALNAGGESPDSNSASAIPGWAAVGPPSSVAAIGLDGGVRVLWDRVGGATGYTVYQRTSSGTSSGEMAVDGCTNVTGGSDARRSCSFRTSPLTGAPFVNRTGPFFFVVRSVNDSTDTDSSEASASPARELCVSLPEMGAVVAIDADTPVGGSQAVDVFPRRWFGNVTQLAQPLAVAVDQAADEVLVLNGAANSITVYSPRSTFGNAAPVRSISGLGSLLSTPAGMVVDTVAHEVFVVNGASGSTSLVVLDQRDGSASRPCTSACRPLRVMSTSTALRAVALGPASDEITVTDGTQVIVYPRTWTGSSPAALRVSTVTAGTPLTNINSLAIDALNNEIWMGMSSGSVPTRVAAIAGSSNGAVTASRWFTIPGQSGILGLAFDPIGDGSVPEVIVGQRNNRIVGYSRITGASTYSLIAASSNYVTQPTGFALDNGAGGDHLLAANRSTGASCTNSSCGYLFQQSVATYRRRDTTTAALVGAVFGPFQAGSSNGFATTDSPQGVASAPLADQLWTANAGTPGGAFPPGTSSDNAWPMTSALLNRTWLVALSNTDGNARGSGIAVNEAGAEVYVSDGGGLVSVFPQGGGSSTSRLPATFSAAAGLAWATASSDLYVADTGSSAISVWTRIGAGAFVANAARPSISSNACNSSACVVNPVDVRLCGTGGSSRLWVANSASIAGDIGAAVVRFDPNTGASGTYEARFAENSVSLVPAAVITDRSSPANVYVGLRSSAPDHWGVRVLGGALGGTPTDKGLLQISGVTHNVGGLAWCN